MIETERGRGVGTACKYNTNARDCGKRARGAQLMAFSCFVKANARFRLAVFLRAKRFKQSFGLSHESWHNALITPIKSPSPPAIRSLSTYIVSAALSKHCFGDRSKPIISSRQIFFRRAQKMSEQFSSRTNILLCTLHFFFFTKTISNYKFLSTKILLLTNPMNTKFDR